MRNYPQNLSRMITTWNCCGEIRCGPYIITYSFDIPMAVMNLFIFTNEEKPKMIFWHRTLKIYLFAYFI